MSNEIPLSDQLLDEFKPLTTTLNEAVKSEDVPGAVGLSGEELTALEQIANESLKIVFGSTNEILKDVHEELGWKDKQTDALATLGTLVAKKRKWLIKNAPEYILGLSLGTIIVQNRLAYTRLVKAGEIDARPLSKKKSEKQQKPSSPPEPAPTNGMMRPIFPKDDKGDKAA